MWNDYVFFFCLTRTTTTIRQLFIAVVEIVVITEKVIVL